MVSPGGGERAALSPDVSEYGVSDPGGTSAGREGAADPIRANEAGAGSRR